MAVEQTIAELLIEIGVDVEGANEAAKKIKGVTDGSKDLEKKGGKSVKGFSKVFAVTAGDIAKAAIAAGKAIFNFVDGITSAGDEIAKSARRAGIGAEEYQRLAFAADRSGASTEAVAKASRNLQKFLNDATQKGTTPFSEALYEVGLSMRELEGLGFEDRLGLISDALLTVEDTSKRTALAQKLLGEEAGPQLASLLESGSEGLRELGDEAERLGLVMGDDALKQSEAFQDQLTNLKATFTGLANTVGTELLPIFSEIIAEVQDWVLANKDLIATKIQQFIRDIVPVVRDLLAGLLDVVKVLGDVIKAMKDFAGALGIGPESAVALMIALKAATTGMPGLLAAAGTAGFVAGQKIAEGFSVAFLGGQRLEAQIRRIQRLQAETEETKKDVERLKKLKALIASGQIGELSEETYQAVERQAAEIFSRGGASPEDVARQISLLRQSRAREGGKFAQAEAEKESGAFEVRFQARQAAIRRLREQFGDSKRITELTQKLGTGQLTEAQAFEQAARQPKGGRGRGGGKKAKSAEEKPVIALQNLGQFFSLKAEEQQNVLRNIAGAQRAPEPAKPTAVVNITNNNFDIEMEINGQANADEIAKQTLKVFQTEYQQRLRQAGQMVQTNVVR